MGAWGYDILSNDDAQDCVAEFGRVFEKYDPQLICTLFACNHDLGLYFNVGELRDAPDEAITRLATIFNEHFEEFFALTYASNDAGAREYLPTELLVLGSIALAIGASLPDTIRQLIINQGIDYELRLDNLRKWHDPMLRKRALTRYQRVLGRHQAAQQWFEDSRGLVEAGDDLYR